MMNKDIEKIKKENEKINAILEFNPNFENDLKNSKGKLKGKIIAVKSNICVKGLCASCASKVLEDYIAPYDAEVIRKVKKEGGVILGMANMDEFAQGSSGETSAFGPTQNPSALGLITGGTSSGSAAAVAAGFCDMALGSDTGGSSRNPASHCGVVGVKPTYSSVSRYGLIDSAMSLDQVGVLAKNVFNAALLLSIIQGKDEKDSISSESEKIDIKEIEKIPKDLILGVLDFEISNKRIQKIVDEKIKSASEKYCWKIKKIKIKNIDLAIQTYYPIVYVEFFSGTRKFDGRRFGKKIEDFCGEEVLRRILGGSEICRAEYKGRYYFQALKAKKLIEKEFEHAFKDVDCIISPTVPRLPHKIGEQISVEDMYGYDALTTLPNLAGNCAISIPAGKINKIPVGIQIICDKFKDEKMLQIARGFEKI
jgi:aspartyl-tRNA(Asn)/glutamyl-tRNA(Gln) amidotransferase subunit A